MEKAVFAPPYEMVFQDGQRPGSVSVSRWRLAYQILQQGFSPYFANCLLISGPQDVRSDELICMPEFCVSTEDDQNKDFLYDVFPCWAKSRHVASFIPTFNFEYLVIINSVRNNIQKMQFNTSSHLNCRPPPKKFARFGIFFWSKCRSECNNRDVPHTLSTHFYRPSPVTSPFLDACFCQIWEHFFPSL